MLLQVWTAGWQNHVRRRGQLAVCMTTRRGESAPACHVLAAITACCCCRYWCRTMCQSGHARLATSASGETDGSEWHSKWKTHAISIFWHKVMRAQSLLRMLCTFLDCRPLPQLCVPGRVGRPVFGLQLEAGRVHHAHGGGRLLGLHLHRQPGLLPQQL